MKLKQLNEQYETVKKVYDAIEDFQRKVDLRHGFKELKENKEYLTEQHRELLKQYADENGNVPQSLQFEVSGKVEELYDSEIEFKNKLKFKEDDLKKAKLTGSEVALIYDDFVSE